MRAERKTSRILSLTGIQNWHSTFTSSKRSQVRTKIIPSSGRTRMIRWRVS
jgi:hypothetical protein